MNPLASRGHCLGIVAVALAVETAFAANAGDEPPTNTSTEKPWLEIVGKEGPGSGKHIVFVTGDEEYRSEQSMPQLARILATRHGFRCTVLFAVDPKTTAIDPTVVDSIPGLDLLDRADLLVIFTRFRDLPDDAMRHVADYVESGRPIVGLRTSTHAFQIAADRAYARYSFDATAGADGKGWNGGFGRHVLGETWVAHHGEHGKEGTRGRFTARGESAMGVDHPVLRGVQDGSVFDPADVYAVRLPLVDGATPLLFGEVVAGLVPDAPAVQSGTANDPRMPIAWVRDFTAPNTKRARVFTTTIGSAEAFVHEGSRRLLVNACLWAVGLDEAIRPELDVSLVETYEPSPFGFGRHRVGVRPRDA